MSGVLGIVRGHGGAIQVETASNQGSTFRVYFPSSLMPATHRPDSSRVSTEWESNGRAIVADDEPIVLRATAAVLRQIGFEVVTASDGAEAVKHFLSNPSEFDLVLLDLTMPKMNGLEATQKIFQARSDAKVVLMSGYSEEAAISAADRPPSAFLEKPFQFEKLKQLLKELFSEGS